MSRPEDTFTSTVDGAAGYERWRAGDDLTSPYDGYSPEPPDEPWDESFSAPEPPPEDEPDA